MAVLEKNLYSKPEKKKQLLPASRASELPAEKGSHLSGVNFLCHARGLSGQLDSSPGGFLTAQFLAELFAGLSLTGQDELLVRGHYFWFV